MTEKIDVVEESVETADRSPLLSMARKVLLAGIGTVALAQEEIEDFVNKLIERGEIAERDGRKLVEDIMERRRKKTHEAEQQLDQRVEDLLDRMNVPTKADIEALSAKIAILTKKVDELKKNHAA